MTNGQGLNLRPTFRAKLNPERIVLQDLPPDFVYLCYGANEK